MNIRYQVCPKCGYYAYLCKVYERHSIVKVVPCARCGFVPEQMKTGIIRDLKGFA